ncbi:MAG: smalltalk protein [Bacteroidaceae bacterium]|nr:smalltalk protein [Bacteroidaceae bacterium]
MDKKELWQKILQFIITILTAIVTTLGTTSCIQLMG